MCGINGFNFKDVGLIKKMMALTSSRGPDNQDFFETEEYVSIISSLEQMNNLWDKYLENQSKYFKNVSKNLDKQIIEKINNTNLIFENIVRLLKSNSIESNLKKGYVLLKNKNKIIKRSIELNKEENIKIKFFDKTINAEIKKN